MHVHELIEDAEGDSLGLSVVKLNLSERLGRGWVPPYLGGPY